MIPRMGAPEDGSSAVNSPEWWDVYLRTAWDAHGGAEQTRHFMRRLIDELPSSETRHLGLPGRTILDWGCAHGEGIDELAKSFPDAVLRGLDVAASAVAEATRRFGQRFVHAAFDAVPPAHDVVVSSNCLEHFEHPWRVAERLARAARDLLVLLVPCEEESLCPSHVVRFDAGSFPERLGDLRRFVTKRIAVDPRHWGGDQLLVLYGSPAYLETRPAVTGADPEQAKWDRHYATVELEAESEAMAHFGREFAETVAELLPDGGRVLEAGAGAGWHALALARTGRFAVTLMDFSEQALRHARRLFAREGLHAEFVLADARAPGAAEFDLVFNSGVLEHFTFDEQVAFVRAMASRSRNLVLALVPNRRCYWYWIWRVRAAANGDWPFGAEIPPAELASVFAAAGLDGAGERVMGAAWTESFLTYLARSSPSLLDCLLAVHRSPVVDHAVKGYLLACAGRVAGAPRPAPAWLATPPPHEPGTPALAAALADALALQVRAQAELIEAKDACETERAAARSRGEELARLHAELAQVRAEAERRDRERTTEREALRAESEAQRAAAHADRQLAEELRVRLEQASTRAASAARERDHLQWERDDARGAHDRLAAAHRELQRAHEAEVAWRTMVEQSRTFRLLRRLEEARATVRRRWTQRPAGP